VPPLYFEDFFEGQEFVSPGRTVTETDVVSFAGLSGDYNPLHIDDEFSKKAGFGRRVAHGQLILTMVSGLKSRMSLTDGTAVAFLGLTWNFKGPVFFGDTIHFRMRISEKRATRSNTAGLIRQAIQVFNQRDEVVQEGEHVMLIERREPKPGSEEGVNQ